ncbi:cytochrome c3 family protein [Aestuariivivens sediminicola]|uniref:cytochrome c3 family protein n=1 Tax=Aestuariivivens sediminicola TaxID=2913560 RepID=UPI001F5A40A1|nr:cytochrome c3 family protein [Aestuariivivens sediminicola]
MKQLVIFILIFMLIPVNKVVGQGISQSRHNLSASGKGVVKTMDDSRVCIFCHTSHSSNPKAPLWNRGRSGAIYTLYNSSTLDAKPGQPDGTSILCLSCHDGTVALGNTYKNPNSMSFAHSMTQRGNLGTDLSDDHPISFIYDAALATTDGELKDPFTLETHVLDYNGKLQCTSCHDSHKDLEGNFLKRSNEFSELCFTCHDVNYWDNSSHNTALNTWNGTAPNPWSHLDSPFNTVSQNSCSNCHDTHNAAGKERLLKRVAEEDNCLDCHNGNTSDKDIQAEFLKPFRHDVYAYTGIHDPMESNFYKTKHIECADCHNAHATNSNESEAPLVKGANLGVKGISRSGMEVNPALNEYEICFKCHSDNPVTTEYTTRYLGTSNTRIDFNPNNISMHPVIEKGKNLNPRGLILPYNAISQIYCSSCHASNGENASKGPHGSIYPRILKANYNLDKTPSLGKAWPALLESNFTLCFECHNINIVTDIHAQISEGHFMEIIGCNTCHDPHGYEGGTLSENGYGINFDRSVIQPNPINGRMIDLDQKKCFMTCHDPRGVINYTHSAEGSDY